jgi:hypothetical protein
MRLLPGFRRSCLHSRTRALRATAPLNPARAHLTHQLLQCWEKVKQVPGPDPCELAVFTPSAGASSTADRDTLRQLGQQVGLS